MKQKEIKKRNTVSKIVSSVILFLSILILISLNWFNNAFSLVNLEQIIYTLSAPLEGTNNDVVFKYISECIPISLALTIVIFLVFNSKYLRSKTVLQFKINVFKKKLNFKIGFFNFERYDIIISFIFLFFALIRVVISFDVIPYIQNQLSPSTFYEDEYVSPSKVNIDFPKQKRNLIYIYLESGESSFSSVEKGGVNKENIIPELTDIALDNVHFSDKEDKLGGAISLPYTTWTMGGLVAQTAGITLNLPTEANSTDKLNEILPGVVTLGDILEKEGYSNVFLMGSEAYFAGRDVYFKEHGNYDIRDYNWAKKEGKIPKDYKVWWGYEDSKLFEFAKETLEELSEKDKPFNVTLLTADTHFQDGYVDKKCDFNYERPYDNSFACSSKEIGEFIDWVKNQDFYDNTTIVIAGDHLTMQGGYFKENDSRHIYNAFINPDAKAENKENRTFGTIDLFPTTLASLGVSIEGNRLGIGTNLFSDRKTILEEKGVETVISNLSKTSNYYLEQFVYNKK